MQYTINLIWDNEASVWVATSDDVEGLVLESGSLDALIERVRFAIPELLELNAKKSAKDLDAVANICFRSERYEKVAL